MLGYPAWLRSPLAFLLLLWLAASAFNISKAVHIDDTAYLAMARAVADSPRHPLSVPFNWGSTSEPLHVINQPLLWPALLAAAGALGEQSELGLRALMAGFTLAAIFFFHQIARQVAPPQARWMTAAFALGRPWCPHRT